MANIVSDQTIISTAESVTGWSGDSFVLEPDIKVEGSNSVAVIQTANGTNTVTYSGSWDMTGSHVRLYMNSAIVAPYGATEASNGIEIVITSGGGTGRWTVSGSDTYKGGWQDFIVNTASIPTSGSINPATVTSVSIVINTNSKPRNSTNGWYDNWRFGNGLTINSSASEEINFQDVADADVLSTNAWGILQDTDGVLFGKGKLTLGSTGSLNCNLVSIGETIYFINRNVSSTLYALVTQEGTGATDIDISGMTCKTVGASRAELDFSTSITSLSVVGSSFTQMGLSQFYTGATISLNTWNDISAITTNGCTFTNNNVNSSGTITVSGGTFTGNTLNKSIATSAVLVSTLADTINNTYISSGTGHAVELTSIGAGSMTWDNSDSGYASTDGSTGNETIYVNVGTGALTINIATGASVPTIRTAGASVTIVTGQRSFNFTVNPAITGYEWRVYSVTAVGSLAGSSELIGEESASVSSQSYTYSYSADQAIAVQILGHANDYEESITYYTLADSDQNITINLKSDTNN